jgi:glycosyltransferase involved in cell wall biosynthesis
MSRPFVSIVTPTYNRSKFIGSMVACYKSQTYPKDRMEWIILDDGTEKVEELVMKHTKGLPNIRYIALEDKLNIGAKRNILNKEAKGTIIIAMDDDDWYSPDRVAHVVTKFANYPTIQLAGCSELYMYYSDTGEILKIGPYNKNHATNGTMAHRKEYAETHFYDETVTHAEEKSFLDNYKNPMIQLESMKTMLVISHSENTFDKSRFRNEPNNPYIKKTKLKIRDFVKDKELREFFSKA